MSRQVPGSIDRDLCRQRVHQRSTSGKAVATISRSTQWLIYQQWQHIETTAKSSIQEKKIRVLFLSADGSASNGAHNYDDASAFTNSPTPAPRTPQRSSEAPIGAVSYPDERPSDSVRDSAGNAPTGFTNSNSSIGAAASSVASAIPTSSEQLQAQLAEARNQISRLTQQAQDQGLRQRKTDAVNQDSKERITTGTTGLGVKSSPANGVPVQVVAGLCLLCFLIAYFFF